MRTNTRAERDARRRAAYARQRAQREAAAVRNAAREDARAAARRAAEAIDALEDEWGGRTRALNELDELSHALATLQREEVKLRAQRDELIDALRAAGASWTLLALRTGLSRQALTKRRGVADVSGRAQGSAMGSIEPYSTSAGRRYRVRYRKPDHSQTDKRGFRTKRDAELFLASVTVSMTRGEWIDPSDSRITVREWGETWFEAQVQVKPATRSGYRYNLDHHIYPLWGERRLVEIGHAEVQEWVGSLSARLKPSTVKQIYLVLSGLMKFAIRDGRLVRNPCEFVRLPPIERKRKGYLTADQVAHVASLCSSDADLVVFLAFTGLRWGEMAALRVASVDFDRRRVAVDESVVELEGVMTWGTPKNHERRSVPFPDFLVGPLAARCAGRSLDAPLFTSASGGLIRNGNFRHRIFEPAVRQAMAEDPGFPWVTPHDLRHTAASLAISAGANVKAVQRLLGHASAAMTLDVYAELFEDDLDAVAAALTHRVGASRVGKMWAEPKKPAITKGTRPKKKGPRSGNQWWLRRASIP